VYSERYRTFEDIWRGKINESILTITRRLTELMDKQEAQNKRLLYVALGSVGILAIFSIINSFDIRSWIDTQIDTVLIIAMTIGAIAFVSLSKREQSCKNSIKEIRDLLIKRINADFCLCNKPCNHKEEFLAEMLKICKINLYY
jgi:predicted membrane channel-forming protein YqfA (hemolysin III family)